MRKTLTAITLIAATLAAPLATTAQAQDWRANSGWGSGAYQNGYGYNGGRSNGYRGGYEDGQVQAVCSGDRAHQLQDRLKYARRAYQISSWQADQINDRINQLKRSQKSECREGDLSAIRAIAGSYNQIEGWIGTADSHERRDGYHHNRW